LLLKAATSHIPIRYMQVCLKMTKTKIKLNMKFKLTILFTLLFVFGIAQTPDVGQRDRAARHHPV
ncbi:MAG: hypothetical protein ACOVOD_03090, partial [Rhodoferax sp.]